MDLILQTSSGAFSGRFLVSSTPIDLHCTAADSSHRAADPSISVPFA